MRIFDISALSAPQHIGGVQTCRGSHTHTVVEDPNDPDTVYIYVSGTAGVRSSAQLAGCSNTPGDNDPASYLDADGRPILTSRFQVEVIEVPLAAQQDAAVINEARLMADPDTGNIHGLWAGGNQGPDTQSATASHACHEITAYPEIGLAAGACQGNGMLIDEWGGGVGARCRPTDPDNWGANAIFDIVPTEDGVRQLLQDPQRPGDQRDLCRAQRVTDPGARP